MRIFSILTAAIVIVVIYLGIFQRDALMNFARSGDVADLAETVPGSQAAMAAEAAEAAALASEIAEASSDDVAVVTVANVPVAAKTFHAQDIENGIILRGRTEAMRSVDMRAETSGPVVSEPLRKGTMVSTGQVLCEIDAGTRGANLAEAKARVATAEIELLAAEKLNQEGFASETRLLSARAGVESAAAGIAAIEKDIARLTVRAPFDGLLESDTAEIGSLLGAGGLCATVISLDPIKMVGFVSEADVNRVALGARAGARLIDGRQVIGTVSFLSRSADPSTRTFRVELEVPNADLSIRDGQTAEMLIETAGVKAHLLPQSALTLDNEGKLGVRTVEADFTAGFYPVTPQNDTLEGIWVTGLPDTVDVITVGQEYVTTGVRITATFDDGHVVGAPTTEEQQASGGNN